MFSILFSIHVFNFRETNFLTPQWCDRPLCLGEGEALQRLGTQGRELSLSPCLFQTCWTHVRITVVLLFPPHHWFLSTLPALHVISPPIWLERAVHVSKHPKNKVLCFYFCSYSIPGTCGEICGWFSNFRRTRRLKININGADSLSMKIRMVRKGLQWEIWADIIDNS